MDQQLKQAKQNIRPYLRQITDQQLAVLTAMAQDGKVVYLDHCKCIRGIVGGCTAEGYRSEHSTTATLAENGLLGLVKYTLDIKTVFAGDPLRNLLFFPMCKAEQRRRERVKNAPAVEKMAEKSHVG